MPRTTHAEPLRLADPASRCRTAWSLIWTIWKLRSMLPTPLSTAPSRRSARTPGSKVTTHRDQCRLAPSVHDPAVKTGRPRLRRLCAAERRLGDLADQRQPLAAAWRHRRLGAAGQAGKACWSRTAISFSTSGTGRGLSMSKRRAPDEVA
jgi:hypothetical protein